MAPIPLPAELPPVPVPPAQFLQHVAANPHVPIRELVKPFRDYETSLRAYFAQAPEHDFVKDNLTNLIDVYGGPTAVPVLQGVAAQSQEERDK